MADWKDGKNLGPWAFEAQENKYGYLNNPRWPTPIPGVTEEPQIWTPEDGLVRSSDNKIHQPCGHWHKGPGGYSVPTPPAPPAPVPISGLYYSLNGIDWTLVTNYNFYSALSEVVKQYIQLNNQRTSNGGTLSIDDFEYLVPDGMIVWNDTFTGNDDDPPDATKWTTANIDLVIKSNTLVLKPTKEDDYLFTKGDGNINIPTDIKLKTTIIAGTGTEYKTVTWQFYQVIEEVNTPYFYLQHYRDTDSDGVTPRRYILGYNYITSENLLVVLGAGDTDVWFRIVTTAT